jgi:hypothetical protein
MKLTASKLNKFLFNCRQRLSVVCVSQLLMKTMCGICKTPMDQSKPIQFLCILLFKAELATGALVMFQIQKW